MNTVVSIEIQGEILELLGHTKNAFTFYILDEMAKTDFSEFIKYISNPKIYALRWTPDLL